MLGERVPLTGCDCFHLALDGMMRRSGQGRNLAQAVLELGGAIPPTALRQAVAGLASAFPILGARIARAFPLGAPHWRMPRRPRALPLHLWREAGGDRNGSGDTRGEVDDVRRLLLDRLAADLPDGANLCVDAIERRDGTSTLVLTWRHVLLDARGGELLVAALARLASAGGDDLAVTQTAPETLAFDGASLTERLRRAAGAGRRLDELRRPAFRSLGGPVARRGAPRFDLMTLDGAEARRALASAARFSGIFAQMAFFLACAIRAHHAVFAARGQDAGSFVVSIPVQTRRKGANGPIFQNHLSILFFGLGCDRAGDLDDMTKLLHEQLVEMMRSRLDQSWAIGLDLARRVPSRVLMPMMRRRFGGEIASFFHSFTGPFAPEVEEIFGARVRNAYHVPAIGQPPGTGLFVGQRGERLNVTLCWRQGSLSDREAELMLASVRADLLGRAALGSREGGP